MTSFRRSNKNPKGIYNQKVLTEQKKRVPRREPACRNSKNNQS